VARQRPHSITTDLPSEAVVFDADAFDDRIRSQGVRLEHFIATRCPIGMTDLDDNRRPHSDHANCSNGFLYKRAGVVLGLLTGNQKDTRFDDVGLMDHAQFQLTVPRSYEDPEDKLITIAPFDRFYLNDPNVVVIYWQLFLAHQSGRDRLNFPVVEVIRLVDNLGREYSCGTDFSITAGQIQWLGVNRPGLDSDTNRGRVCSVRYTYRPYVYVGPVLHDLRVSAAINPLTGEQAMIRMPQAATVHREYVFLNEKHDPDAIDSSACRQDQRLPSKRQEYGPQDGSFGPK